MDEVSNEHDRPSMDAALDALANRYRRRLLVALLAHNPQDADDTQLPVDETLSDDDAASLRVAIRHSHLPKLEALGFVEWDREERVVRKGPRFDAIRPVLELMDAHADELPDEWV